MFNNSSNHALGNGLYNLSFRLATSFVVDLVLVGLIVIFGVTACDSCELAPGGWRGTVVVWCFFDFLFSLSGFCFVGCLFLF
jgi:hypothetical protein